MQVALGDDCLHSDGVRRRTGYLAALVVIGLTAPLVAWALAATSTTTLVSTGPAGGNEELPAFFQNLSADGSRMIFTSDETLHAEDTDTARDLYQRSGGITTLVSIGPNGGNSNSHIVESGEISPDGSRVLFETEEQLVLADTDTRADLYERAGGVTTWVSTGPGATGGNGDFDVDPQGMSDDGTRVFLSTEEQLVTADTDGFTDIYERAAGTTTLVSTGPAGGNGNFQAAFSVASADGTRVFFDTQEQLVAGDTDAHSDTYERSGGATTLISTGPTDTHTFGNTAQAISTDGTHAFLQTAEPLVASDMDTKVDVYDRAAGTTTLLSTGPAGGNGNVDAGFQDSSADGTRAFFNTTEALVAGDSDSALDIYERSGGVTTLVSAGGNGAFDAQYRDASQDGTRVFFRTAEPLVAADADTKFDVYQRWRGATTLLSTGPAGGNGALDTEFQGASADGRRAFFTTDESLVAGDSDVQQDVYERSGGETSLISTGTAGGNGAFPAAFGGTSADGTLAFFSSPEQLLAEDTDSQADIYQASISAPPPDPDPDPEVPVEPEIPKPPDDVVPDTAAPQSTITKRPRNRTRKRLSTFRFRSTEAGSTFECKLDRRRYVPCRSPRRVRVRPGRHVFRVRAIDAAGNRDATPAVDRWIVLRKQRRPNRSD